MPASDDRFIPLDCNEPLDIAELGHPFTDTGSGEPCRATQPASLPDEVWDVFRLDEDHWSDEPEPGDFWVEPDTPDDQ
jgi:hypothetical protein